MGTIHLLANDYCGNGVAGSWPGSGPYRLADAERSGELGNRPYGLASQKGRTVTMSEFKGVVTCPHCGCHHFKLEDWDTYVSLWCVECKRKVREVIASHLPSGITVTLPGGRS